MSHTDPHSNRTRLIDQLAQESAAGVRPFALAPLLTVWWLLSWVFVVTMTLLTGSLRPGWQDQLAGSLRFSIETGLGIAAGLLLCIAAFRSAVPGPHQRRWTGAALMLALLWIGSFVMGLAAPTFETAVIGARPGCEQQVLLFGLPAMLAGLWLMRRGYVLNWPLAGAAIGLAAGFIPATLMLVACWYQPQHILGFHIFPALLLGLGGGMLGLGLQWLDSRRP